MIKFLLFIYFAFTFCIFTYLLTENIEHEERTTMDRILAIAICSFMFIPIGIVIHLRDKDEDEKYK